jgi:hypothetical protein
MGSTLSLIHLPAQSGKTGKMTDIMNKLNQLAMVQPGGTNNLNVIFTSNTKILTKQTQGRIASDVKSDQYSDTLSDFSDAVSDLSESDEESEQFLEDDTDGESRTLAWISGGKKSKTEGEVFADLFARKKYDNIVCCMNKKRTHRMKELLVLLYAVKYDREINLWVDEADECISIWNKFIRDIQGFGDLIQNVVMVTATMMPVYKFFWKRNIECKLRVYPTTTSDVYLKFADIAPENRIVEYSNGHRNAFEHVTRVLDSVEHPPNTRWFVPGDKDKASHVAISNNLLERNFNVLLVNGDIKAILFADRRDRIEIKEDLDQDLEISKVLCRLYHEHKLYESPFAVTGHMCVSRGITFASKTKEYGEFIFTHGIISDVNSPDDAYQLVARVLGNIRGYDTYQEPTIFLSDRMSADILIQEGLAVKLALACSSNGDESRVVTKEMVGEIAGNEITEDKKKPKDKEKDYDAKDFSRKSEEFATQAENDAFAMSLGGESSVTYDEDENGFKLCSSGTKKVHSYADIKKLIDTKNIGSNMPMNLATLAKGGVTMRKYVCYRDMSDNTSAIYVTIYVKRLNGEPKLSKKEVKAEEKNKAKEEKNKAKEEKNKAKEEKNKAKEEKNKAKEEKNKGEGREKERKEREKEGERREEQGKGREKERKGIEKEGERREKERKIKNS